MQKDLILHLDMDGVLSDFDSAFIKISGGLTPEQYRQTHGKGGEASLFLKDGGNFFAGLDWIEGGRELVDFSLRHFRVVRILTSAGTGKDWVKFKEIQAAKVNWITSRVPQIPKMNIIVVPFANLKSRHSGDNRILVDDHVNNIKQWDEKGGIGILHHHSDWKRTITDLEALADCQSEIVETL